MSQANRFKRKFLSASISCLIAATSLSAMAQDEDAVELEDFVAEEEVQDDLGLLPTEPVDSVFGFGKTLLETPRSASSISTEVLERYAMSDIDDLVVLSPGAFTQSFFGVAGALDVRGTPGEVYFRGIVVWTTLETTQRPLVHLIESILFADQQRQSWGLQNWWLS